MTKGKTAVRKETSAMAVVFFQNKILATVEDIYGKPALSLPKGHVEEGETNVQTAIRECREETGITLSAEQVVLQTDPFVVNFENHLGEKVQKSIFPVVFRLQEKQSPRITEQRVLSVDFLDVADFSKRCSYDNVRQLVADICSKISH